MKTKKEFFLSAYKLGIIKFGKFTLKSGIQSPFYVDLRPLVSDPGILRTLSHQLLEVSRNDRYDLICGVPYAALPMAASMSLESGLPLIMKRKEAKGYGTKKLIEGIYSEGQNCLVVEDVITSGKSLLETIPEIEKEGLKVTDIVVVLDREQGGKQLLEAQGYRVHVLLSITEAVEILKEHHLLEEEEVQRIRDFIKGNVVHFEKEKRKKYEEKDPRNEKARRLLEIAQTKKSNLIASADVTTTAELLDLAHRVGPHIVALKTHIDILSDFDFEKTILSLKDLAEKHQFLLMEDRKFADIGNTQELQFKKGIYRISEWADLITTQVIAGEKALDCFKGVGIIPILGMSSAGALTDEHYRSQAMTLIKKNLNVVGCVAQDKLTEADLLLFTPGVNLEDTGDSKGQQYNTPEDVFERLHTDFIIVGRGIYKSDDPAQAAKTYQTAGWEAYLKSL